MSKKNNKNVAQPAWDLFSKGDLAGAERAAMLYAQQSNNTAISPIPDIMILKAYYLCRLHRFDEARRLFVRVLDDLPDDIYAQNGLLLALGGQLKIESKATTEIINGRSNIDQNNNNNGTLIIGIGTGRTGSTTLTKLWMEQKYCYSSHEHPPRMEWVDPNGSRFDFHKQKFDMYLKKYKYVCDASHWWLNYIEQLIINYRNIRIIVLKRDRESTIKSFMRIKGGENKGGMNHWMRHNGSFWAKNPWDECYPKYNATNIQQAIGMYWDEYYKAVEKLISSYPSIFAIFHTEELGDVEVQKKLLSFCGFKNQRYIKNIHLNKEHAIDGTGMY